ncbi:hypothetical protein PNEG_00611 [Pneumocystis murina B123]|uniref:Importin-95 n=1 Tax=Pneumocystis murina (strain B123) TaxID=1069680 RepID=M7NV56_PNEMU|nr:hypothetical protein PNEG_00611 [Pneumocystis murina B123]EMR11011.1 hypothetical protein PNEG_00611 [Pneumocystis murina B123]
MNISELLANTLSSDARLRADATQQLEVICRNHWSVYMHMLSQELVNEQSPSHIRSASGLALKNSLTSKERYRQEEYNQKWLSLEQSLKQQIKQNTILTLASQDGKAGQAAAQFIAAIAAIELPINQWPELMATLVQNVSEGQNSNLKQASLQAIGYICETVDPNNLAAQSNAILTAVVQGARKEEPNSSVRLAAVSALFDSLEFVKENFEREGERNYIMQVVCEATQSEDVRVQITAFGCLVRIMQLYYDKMKFYMEKALFGLTVLGMKHDDEKVALQAVEFWSTVCEEEIDVNLEIQEALENGISSERENFQFAKIALPEVLPVLLQLMCKQDEDVDEDEWNISMAAGTCVQLFSQCVEGIIVGPVLTFVEANIRSDDWKRREAGVMALGSILEGPDPKLLETLMQEALPVLISMMSDPVVQVQDTTAWTLGRISDLVINAISPEIHLPSLIHALLNGLNANPRIVSNCCWALMNLSEQLDGCSYGSKQQTSIMSPYFENIVSSLLGVTERTINENNSRTSAYEALSTIVTHSSLDMIPIVSRLLIVILERLERTIAFRDQIIGVDERTNHEKHQSNLCNTLTSIIRRLGADARPSSDRIMTILFQLIQSASRQSIIHEDVFLAISALTLVLDGYFCVYLDSFVPFLYSALSNIEEYQLCSIAVGLIGDISRALGDKVIPYCDNFMTHLLQNLQSSVLHPNVKPVILSCFGDIALAIGSNFMKYLEVVMQLLQQASIIYSTPDQGYEMIDYVNQLREGIVEAYVGIVQALKEEKKSNPLLPHIPHIFRFLAMMHNIHDKSESLTRAMIGLLGDLADIIPSNQISSMFQEEWVNECLKQGRTKPGYSSATKEIARWSTEQIKAVINGK